jgi:hypothetical protein
VKNDRLRVSIDEAFLSSLGLATLCFARLEWDAVWCCEKIEPGYIDTVTQKTAGQIANDLIEKVSQIPDEILQQHLRADAESFQGLVRRRNDLVHAKPCTAPTGEQRLARDGIIWSIQMIDDLADAFTTCSITLNDHHHHNL